MKSFGFFLIASVFGFSAHAASENREFDSKGLNKVVIVNTAGKNTITATEGAKAIVEFTKNTFSDKCSMSIEKNGGTLKVEVKKSGLFSDEDCDVDFAIQVPKAVNLDLTVGSGKLLITGIQGELNFKLGSGNIIADGNFKKIDGKTGSGDVEVKGLTGGGELRTGSGEINLTFGREALKGAIDLKTGSGDATLLFPKDAKIKTDFTAGSGRLQSELSETAKADFQVSMKAGSGDLKIKTY